MIIPIIITVNIVIMFYIMCIEGLIVKPLIKRRIRLNKNYALAYINSIFIVKNNLYTLVFYKNLFLKILGKEFECDLILDVKSKFVKYYATLSRLTIYYENLKIFIDKNGINFDAKESVNINISFIKPGTNFKLMLEQSKLIIDKLKFTCFGVFNLKATTQNKKVNINFDVRQSFIKLGLLFNILSKAELKNFKLKNWGIVDTKQWKYLPDFTNNTLLHKKYYQNLLQIENNKVYLPNFIPKKLIIRQGEKVSTNCGIDLNMLGMSKIIEIKTRGKILYVRDLLTKLSLKFKLDNPCEYKLINWFGDYLLLFSKTVKVEVEVFGKFLDNNKLYRPLVFGVENLVFPTEITINNVLDNINRLLLHGLFIDISGLIKMLNTNFLPPTINFKLANCLMSFICCNEQYFIINDVKIKKFLLSNLSFCLKHKNKNTISFIKKILPFIQNKLIYDKLLELVLLDNKIMDYEGWLTQMLGYRLKGNTLSIKPTKYKSLNINLWVRGRIVYIILKENWKCLKINNLLLVGVDNFNLKNYKSLIFKFE